MTEHAAHAPGSLELVRRFVNTRDIEAGTDQLASPRALVDWLRQESLLPGRASATAEDVGSAVHLRESLREAMAANHDRAPAPPDARTVINTAAKRAQLTFELAEDGAWSLRADATGVAAALGSIVAEMARAMTTSEWSRLKVCANDACRWAFYDHSRARTGRWCSMQVCGNQSKQKSWRSRVRRERSPEQSSPRVP